MHAPIPREKLEAFERTLAEAKRRVAKQQQTRRGWHDEEGVRQGGLIAFVRYYWSILEPETPFVDGWPLWAMCEHLEAVTFGEITRLLINVPPGFMKSLLVDVFWPAWEWGPMGKSHLRYVAFSYSASLTERDNGRFRDLITHDSYQILYGAKKGKAGVALRNKTTLKVVNTRTGWKLASSVGGVGTGERGDRIILDDPHNVKESESDTVRSETVRWFREAMSNRLNDIEAGVIIVIMQRVHSDDVSGIIISQAFGYCHLCIPMEFEGERCLGEDGGAYPTEIGWIDPRFVPTQPDANDGEVAWPERFPPEALAKLHHQLGPYAWAGQYQQSPTPRGGGIFQRAWWQLWQSDDGKFPTLEYIVASLDGAFTEDEENDPSALTIWGVFLNEQKRKRIVLINAWRRFLKFSAPKIERLRETTIIEGQKWFADAVLPGMPIAEAKRRNEMYRRRCRPQWGLIEWVADSCREFKVDLLLIEAKASGISAATELQNRHGGEGWAIQLMPVKGDKVARALAAQPTFSQLMVYAPNRSWADDVIDEMEKFPKDRHDDLTDSATQAINYLRGVGLAQTDDEANAVEIGAVTHKPKLKAIYPV